MISKDLVFILACTRLLPALVGLYRWKHADILLRSITLYFLIGFVNEVALTSMATKGINNLWLANLYIIFELVFLTTFFFKIINKRYILYVGLALLILSVIVPITSPGTFNGLSMSLDSLFFLLLGLISLKNIDPDFNIIDLFKFPNFWILSGLTIYFGSAMMTFVQFNFFSNYEGIMLKLIWDIHAIISVICNIIYTIGLWKLYSYKQSRTHNSLFPA